MRCHAGLPQSFWCFAHEHSEFVYNRLPTMSALNQGRGEGQSRPPTPVETFKRFTAGSFSELLSRVKVFGAYTVVYRHVRRKIDFRGRECMYVGEHRSISCSILLDLETCKLFHRRVKDVHEHRFPAKDKELLERFPNFARLLAADHTSVRVTRNAPPPQVEHDPTLDDPDLNIPVIVGPLVAPAPVESKSVQGEREQQQQLTEPTGPVENAEFQQNRDSTAQQFNTNDVGHTAPTLVEQVVDSREIIATNDDSRPLARRLFEQDLSSNQNFDTTKTSFHDTSVSTLL